MNYFAFDDDQLEIIESVLTDWEKGEMSEISPRRDMLRGLREARFRAVDVPRTYRNEKPWEVQTEPVETLVYAINEELGRDAVPRDTGFGFPSIVEATAEYEEEDEALERLHDDVAMVTAVAHKFGWTLHEYTTENIMLIPAEDEHTVDDL